MIHPPPGGGPTEDERVRAVRLGRMPYAPDDGSLQAISRGDCPCPKDNRFSLDITTLAIFPEYVEFDGEEVLKLGVLGEAGKTIK